MNHFYSWAGILNNCLYEPGHPQADQNVKHIAENYEMMALVVMTITMRKMMMAMMLIMTQGTPRKTRMSNTVLESHEYNDGIQ